MLTVLYIIDLLRGKYAWDRDTFIAYVAVDAVLTILLSGAIYLISPLWSN